MSHRLLLRAGMIRKTSAGIYAWLPMGFRVLAKITRIVREEQNRCGVQEMLMPTIQPAEPWKLSGRYAGYGQEMLRFSDRHRREMLYGPTNEELITQIFANNVRSYTHLPLYLYHIQWKFRDEIRPRFGVMRGREFLMKDSYSFDVDADAARASYRRMFVAYLKTFAQMGLRALPVEAESGPIGGDLSHEFVVFAPAGESEVYCDRSVLEKDIPAQVPAYDDAEGLEVFVRELCAHYVRTEDTHDREQFERRVAPERRYRGRSIEVGHVFYFGTKYASPLGALVVGPQGERIPVHMGSYGIGVSRLVGAIVEANHDERGIIWPLPVAPFSVGLVTLKPQQRASARLAADFEEKCLRAGLEVLHDDRPAESAGVKFAEMDLLGIPWQVVVGPKEADAGCVVLKRRGERTLTPIALSPEDAVARLAETARGSLPSVAPTAT